MRWFHNLKIAPKLLLAFAAMLSLVVVLGVFAILQLKKLDHASDEVTQKWAPAVSNILKIKYSVTRYRTYELQHAISNTTADFDKYENSMRAEMNDVNRLMQDYRHLLVSTEEKRIYDELAQSLAAYDAAAGKVTALSRAGDLAAARDVIRGDSRKYNFQSADLINELVRINEEGSARAEALVNDTYTASRALIVGLIFACVALGVMLAIAMARAISSPLRRAVDIAHRVAAGDLTAHIAVTTRDETGELLDALRTMNDSLRMIVAKVRNGTDTIASASSEIAASNLDLSSRTEEQAALLEETTATMQQLTSTVRQNADSAKEASRLAFSTAATATEGGKMMEDVVGAIAAIQASSSRIADIIGVIDGIAFQTNLLALNASVEAARAGEQGRGFAVVAAEVRNLAQRSAAAAKEIKQLIQTSSTQVDTGTALVGSASTTIARIVGQVRQVSNLVGDISIATGEQSRGIEQINVAMTQMDQVTQQNAALVEEAAAAAAALQQQADDLTRTVGNFKLADDAANNVVALPVPTVTAQPKLPRLQGLAA